MSNLNKTQLTQDNQSSFPNNNVGYITPEVLRNFNQDMIDSLALQTQADYIQFEVNGLIASGSGVKVSETGSILGTATTLNFTGSVDVSLNNGTASIFVYGQSGTNGTSGKTVIPANTNQWQYKQGFAPSVPANAFDVTTPDNTFGSVSAIWVNCKWSLFKFIFLFRKFR